MKANSSAMLTLAVLMVGASAAAQTPVTPGVMPTLTEPVSVVGARIGFVDLGQVLTLSREGQAMVARVDEVRAKLLTALEARGKDVQALESRLAQAGTVMSDAARAQLQRQFERARVDFQRESSDAQAEVEQVQRELEQAFLAKAFPVVEAIARERELWAVFDIGSSGVLWRAPALDLSGEVAQRLDVAP